MLNNIENSKNLLKRAIPFLVNERDDTYYQHIKSILESTPTSFTNTELTFPLPNQGWSQFHKDILDKILKPNDYLMKVWSFAAWFHGYDSNNHATFKKLNQTLNLALTAIYDHTRPNPVDERILMGIEQLLLQHLQKMQKSNLFKRELPDLYINYVHNVSSNLVIRTSSGYVFEVEERFVEPLSASLTKELNDENKALKAEDLQHKKKYADLLKTVQKMQAELNTVMMEVSCLPIHQPGVTVESQQAEITEEQPSGLTVESQRPEITEESLSISSQIF